MVNFYSMGYGMYSSPYYGYNVHQSLKNSYGVGYEDFGTRPYVQPYPMAIVQRSKPSACEENGFCKFIKKFLF